MNVTKTSRYLVSRGHQASSSFQTTHIKGWGWGSGIITPPRTILDTWFPILDDVSLPWGKKKIKMAIAFIKCLWFPIPKSYRDPSRWVNSFPHPTFLLWLPRAHESFRKESKWVLDIKTSRSQTSDILFYINIQSQIDKFGIDQKEFKT